VGSWAGFHKMGVKTAGSGWASHSTGAGSGRMCLPAIPNLGQKTLGSEAQKSKDFLNWKTFFQNLAKTVQIWDCCVFTDFVGLMFRTSEMTMQETRAGEIRLWLTASS
jgi:hypothetical protein